MTPPASNSDPASSSGEQPSLTITPRFHHACDQCRRKKIKCDGTKPNCNNCHKACAECHYSLVAPRKAVRRGNMNNIKSRLDSLEELIGPLVSQISRLNATLVTGAPSTTDSGVILPGLLKAGKTPVSSSEAEGSESDSTDRHDNSVTINAEEHPTTPTVTPTTRPQSKPPRSFITPTLLQCPSDSSLVTTRQGVSPADKVSRRLAQDHDTSSYMNIPPALRDELLAIFHFKHCYPLYCAVEALMTPRVGANIPDYLYSAAMAIGSRYCTDPRVRREPAYYSGFALFEYAEAQLHTILEQPSLYSIITLLVLSLYKVGLGHPRKSWLYAGMGLRMVVQLGLNAMDSPDHRKIYAQYDTEGLQIRRSLFWLAFIIDKMCAVGSGNIIMLHDEDVMVHLPPLSSTVAQWAEGGLPANALPLDNLFSAITFTDINHYIIRMFSLHGQVGTFVNRSWKAHDSTYECFQKLERSLTRFYSLLPAPFRLNPQAIPVFHNPGDNLKLSYLVQLNVVYFASLIILYRSNLSKNVIDPRRKLPAVKQSSRDKCLEASRMITALVDATSTILAPDLSPSFMPLMLAFSTTIYCNCVVSADRNLRAEACRAIQIHERSFHQSNTYWGLTSVMIELCRSILVHQSELALVRFPFDSAQIISKGLYDIAVACSVGDKSNDEWIIPNRSQYTDELFALKINGWHPSCAEDSTDSSSRELAITMREVPKFIHELNQELWDIPKEPTMDSTPELTSRKRPRSTITGTSWAGNPPARTSAPDDTQAWATMLTEQFNRNTFSNVIGNEPCSVTMESTSSLTAPSSIHPTVFDILRGEATVTPNLAMLGPDNTLLPNGGSIPSPDQPTLSMSTTSSSFTSGSSPLSVDHSSDQKLTSDNTAVTQTLLELLHGTQWGTSESTTTSSDPSSDNTSSALLSTLGSTDVTFSGSLDHPPIPNPTTPLPAALEQYLLSISQATNHSSG
ncbi:hypothetical protein IWQ62_002450 [Dispira parvispora]|uniref:Zn(2)-C6 fungal-type domain-containing protein n=1 Tax=Dispira parvispora TaxID=1520584 RepID=A0A9W8AVN7_9FUNG|nr:hypothetical protein IWQ62_002450 [Dispira parvispora]